MACYLVGAKPLSEAMQQYCKLDPYVQTSMKFEFRFKHFHARKCIWKCRLRSIGHFISASITPPYNMICNMMIYMTRPWPGYGLELYLISPGQNGRHLTDDIFKCSFMNSFFFIQISLKFVPKGSIDYNLASVEVMAWRQIGAKPLSKPMLTQFTDAYMRH